MNPRDTQSAVTVRLLRACRGWSQGELARRAGVDPAALSRYEAGEVRPLRDTLRRLAAAAGVVLEEAERFGNAALTARAPHSSGGAAAPEVARIVEQVTAAAIVEILAVRGSERIAS